MKTKSQLRTVRFTSQEGTLVASYLKQNPVFESFSALARVATLSFISEKAKVHLNPISIETQKKRPAFLWDYELSEIQVREILNQSGLSDQKKWLIERILTQARFEEVLAYLNVNDIERALPHLRLPSKIKQRWEYAINRWSSHG